MKNKIKSTIWLISICVISTLSGQSPSLHSPQNNLINSKTIENNPLGLLWWKCDSMNPFQLFTIYKTSTGLTSNDSMVITKQWSDKQICLQHVLYQHYHKNILVESSEFREHYDPMTNNVVLSNGRYVENLDLANVPTITEDSALSIALNFVNADKYAWNDDTLEHYLKLDSVPEMNSYFPKGELIFALIGDRNIVPANYRLAWKFRIFATVPHSDENIYIDANNGLLIKTTTNECSGDINHVLYGTKNIDTRFHGGSKNKFYLETNDNGRNIHSKDGNYFLGWSLFNLPDDNDDNWGNSHWAATSAHHVVQESWDMFKSIYGRNGMDDNGKEIRVHANDPETADNAKFAPGNSKFDRIKIGSITGGTLLATYDIAGHEFTHGVDQNSGNLTYERESGALDESFSDIFGLMIERHAKGGIYNWTIGEDANFTLRDMQMPSNFSQPNWYLNHTNWININGCNPSKFNDHCAVHTNSGVQNRYFYLLSNGGTQLGKYVQGVGIEIAAKVTYYSFTNLTGSAETYPLAREHAVAAARILYGKCSFVENQVCRAWSACNIGPYCEPCAIVNNCRNYGCESTPTPIADLNDLNNKGIQIKAYPNPATNLLKFKFITLNNVKIDNTSYTVKLVDIFGRIHIEKALNTFEIENGLAITELPAGVYTATITSKNSLTLIQSFKFVKL